MGKQINQYTKVRDRNTINELFDLLDIDSNEGGKDPDPNYESAKITIEEFIAYIRQRNLTLYSSDGSFGGSQGDRNIGMGGQKLKLYGGKGVEFRVENLQTAGFDVRTVLDESRARLFTDNILDLGYLELENADGITFRAKDGEIESNDGLSEFRFKEAPTRTNLYIKGEEDFVVIQALANDINSGGLSLGLINVGSTSTSIYGVDRDAIIYSSTKSNGLNILSGEESLRSNHIGFWAGKVYDETPDLYIKGSDSGVGERGDIGFGTKNTQGKVHIKGGSFADGRYNLYIQNSNNDIVLSSNDKRQTYFGGQIATRSIYAILTPNSGVTGWDAFFDWNNGNSLGLNMPSGFDDVDVIFQNPIAGASYLIHVNCSANSGELLFPTNVKFANPYQVTKANAKIDVIVMFYTGTYFLASYTQNL